MPRTSKDGPSLREQRRRQHQELSRTQILDGAEEVFARKGFHDATIKEIATLAEYSVGAVYSFFENKDDLFVQIYLRRGGEFMEGMRSLLAVARKPMEQLLELADFQIGFFREHANFGRLFLRASGVTLGDLESKIDHVVADNYDEAMALQAKLFREGQESAEIRDGDINVLAAMFSGLVSAYQSTDPAVVGNGAVGDEAMSLDEFHEILDGAFGKARRR